MHDDLPPPIIQPRPANAGQKWLTDCAGAAAKPISAIVPASTPSEEARMAESLNGARNKTADDITAEVLARFSGTSDPRLRQIMLSLINHLHAFVKEVQLTEA